MLVQTVTAPRVQLVADHDNDPQPPRRKTWWDRDSPSIDADGIRPPAHSRPRCRAHVLPEMRDVSHLYGDGGDGTSAEPRGTVYDESGRPSHDPRVAQRDLSGRIAKVFLYDDSDLIQTLQRGCAELLLHNRRGEIAQHGVLRVVRWSARAAAGPRALDEAEHLRVEPVVLVQPLGRLAIEENGLRRRVDESE